MDGGWRRDEGFPANSECWNLHPVPDAVFDLLEELAALSSTPLTVILERDGAYPPMEGLLLELDLARLSIRRGRERQNRLAVEPIDVGEVTQA